MCTKMDIFWSLALSRDGFEESLWGVLMSLLKTISISVHDFEIDSVGGKYIVHQLF